MAINKKNLQIIALSPVGEGISGSDRIFIEFARLLSKKDIQVTIVTWEDGIKMCERNGLTKKQVSFRQIKIPKFIKTNFLLCYVSRIVQGTWFALTKDVSENREIIYSASDFWMDVFPAVVLKLRDRKVFWIATWYQTAPNPFNGFAEGKRENKYRMSAFLYWSVQIPVKPLIKWLADMVFVNNEDEKKQFPKLNKQNKVRIVLGAVDVERIKNWQEKHKPSKKRYDAVFQGRFHPQKGVVELIEIWRKVVDALPSANLAMIGDGPLMEDVKKKIEILKLENNVKLFGYVFDGDKKYTLFQESKIVVHPALYDSGGMAAAEAMAFDLPCVGFDLKSYESYYPQGMVKVSVGSHDLFAERIICLLKKSEERNKIGDQARNMIENRWSWEKRTTEVFKNII